MQRTSQKSGWMGRFCAVAALGCLGAGGTALLSQSSNQMQAAVISARVRLPGNVPRVARAVRLRMKDAASGRTLGFVTVYPPGPDGVSFADWPVAALAKDGGDTPGDGCGDDRFRFKLLPPDETKIPDMEVEDAPLDPELVKRIKELAGQKTGVCGATVAVNSGGRMVPGVFHPVEQGPVQATKQKDVTCQCEVTDADRRNHWTQTCVCNAKDFPTCEECCGHYVRTYEKSKGMLTRGGAGQPGFDSGLANEGFGGQVVGPRLPGAVIGLKHPGTGRVVASAPVAENGSFRVPAPPAGSPPPPYQVCIAVRSPQGLQDYCGRPGEESPALNVPGGVLRVRHDTAKNSIQNVR